MPLRDASDLLTTNPDEDRWSLPWHIPVLMTACTVEPELAELLSGADEDIREALMTCNPSWVQIALEAMRESEIVSEFIHPHVDALSDRLSQPYWRSHLEASRCLELLADRSLTAREARPST